MFLELIKNKKIAIVGPSSSLANKKLGKLIDNHDIVIKINRFQDLLSIDYGSKTDILFYNFCNSVPNKTINNSNCRLIVGGHSFKNFPNNIKNMQKSLEIYKTIPHEYYPEEELSEDMQQIIDSHCWKTTGFWVICLLFNKINIIKQLNIFGIDFCFNRYNIKYNNSNIAGGHDMNKELYLFKNLFKKYKENKKIIIFDKDFLKYLNN